MVEKYIFLKNSFLADKHSGDLQKSLLSKYESNRLQVFAWRFAFFEARGKHPHKSVDRIIAKESATGGTRKFRMTNPASWCLSCFTCDCSGYKQPNWVYSFHRVSAMLCLSNLFKPFVCYKIRDKRVKIAGLKFFSKISDPRFASNDW